MQQNLFYFPHNIFIPQFYLYMLLSIKHMLKIKYQPGLKVNPFCDADRHVQFLPCTCVCIILPLVENSVCKMLTNI